MANYNENGLQIPIFKIEQSNYNLYDFLSFLFLNLFNLVVNVLASFNIKVTVNELKRPSVFTYSAFSADFLYFIIFFIFVF